MGISGVFIAFPLFSMTIAILIGGGVLTGNGSQPFCIGGTGSNSGLTCTIAPNGLIYQCNNTSSSCTLPYHCPTILPSHTTCSVTLGNLWLLFAQSAVFIPTAQISSLGPLNNSGNQLVFGNITSAGFTVMIAFATAVVVFGSLNFLGSGENTEGIHIAYITGMLLGLWGILSAADGFIVGSPTSFFSELDNLIAGAGTGLYLFLTLFMTLGIIGTVSRSSGSSGGV